MKRGLENVPKKKENNDNGGGGGVEEDCDKGCVDWLLITKFTENIRSLLFD